MGTELALSTKKGEIVEHAPAPLEAVGKVANGAAAKHAIGDYLSRKADNTIRAHGAGLQLFADYLEDVAGGLGAVMRQYAAAVASWQGEGEGEAPDPGAWRGVTWGIVAAFVKWQVGEGYAIGSINQRLSAVKVHARLAAKAGAIGREELAMIKEVSGYAGKEARRVDERRDVTRVGDKKAEPTKITAEQARTLLTAHDMEEAQGRRDALIMAMLLEHGMRVSEVADLVVQGSAMGKDGPEWVGVDLAHDVIGFYRTKTGDVTRHELERHSRRALRAYLENDAPAVGRLILGSVKGGELNGRPMSKRAISKRVRYLGKELLELDGLSPHDCRHFGATHLAANGTDPFALRDWGGWKSMAMPSRYVAQSTVANERAHMAL